MLQNAYSEIDLELFNPVHIAGMQTRATDILHGTFRTEMKVFGYDGGTCASFFWYHVGSHDVHQLELADLIYRMINKSLILKLLLLAHPLSMTPSITLLNPQRMLTGL